MSPRLIAAGLLGTLAIGLWLRWFLAGVGAPFPPFTSFAYIRHAHSHLGYYAVLVPLGWLAWERASGRVALHRGERRLYVAATFIATIGFVQRGYGLLGIVGSTVVGALWMVAAWRVARTASSRSADGAAQVRAGGALRSDDPMVAVLPGTILALACIPLIAMTLRSNPAFAAQAVQSFLTAMLFLVVAPSAVTALELRQRWAWGAVITGALSALALGLWPSVITRIGLALHALYWIDVGRRVTAPMFALPWLAAALGLLAVASGAVPLTHDVAVGAIHFLVLGPFLSALAQRNLARAAPQWAWWIHHAATALLAGSLLLRGTGWAAMPSAPVALGIASAVGGSVIALWWLAITVRSFSVRPY